MDINPYVCPPRSADQSPRRANAKPALLLVACAVTTAVAVIMGVSITGAFLAGLVIGESQNYHRLGESRESQVAALIAQNPDRFGDLRTDITSTGGLTIYGEVASQKDLQRLRNELISLFGEELARDFCHVQVSEAVEQR
jgi:hypothetical protein